ncbi:DUF2332 domain-containing protein [Nocardioides lianchengensis]|uniref:Uncharacterized protein n=1 Tax=Nocardioides lianchengensis TaxID=1045774 RepID=A0A1G6L7Y5_9ACTN|nr:DUF2332 domain-containing protein [Nocardioides lianchengensis]NYG12653.1 hypothetical protein [Nocardioides lianchengensis]SDC39311.1 hypothetical protein SAMN05421872_102148 [Nocardioides lianchengensis]
MDVYGELVDQYADFGRYAAADSACFGTWAAAVADDADVLAWLGTLPPGKAQPNLVFAAARWHGVPAPGPYDALRDALLGDDGRIRATILERRTQTNEVGRLATLVPAIATLGIVEPVALLEVGPSAGLVLYPDRWSYAWETEDGTVTAGTGLALRCRVRGPAPLPAEPPRVAWRGGVDLHPLDVADADAMAWLTTLVWPEQDARRAQLQQAIEVARADPPDLRTGDLLEELPALVAEASSYGPVVVFHTAVIAYLTDPDRERFHDLMTGLVADGACRWVSNEGKRVLPRVTATGPPVPEERATFVLGVDGRAVAWTHGHGRSMRWLA